MLILSIAMRPLRLRSAVFLGFAVVGSLVTLACLAKSAFRAPPLGQVPQRP